MNTYVVLLRGVNVGGNHKLPMKELAQVLTSAGCEQVQTYIQSGNAVFRAGQVTAEALAASLEASFGFPVPVVLRTAQQMKAVANGNPFLSQQASAEHLHVVFLSRKLKAGEFDEAAAQRFAPDVVKAMGHDLYLWVPAGLGISKSPAWVDARLKAAGVIGTTRNWRTTLKLQEMAAELEHA